MLDKRIIMVTGKGGVGKTSICCALAYYASSKGKKVLLLESSLRTDNEGTFSKFFGVNNVKNEIHEVYPNIFVLNLDHSLALKNYVLHKLKINSLYTILSRSKSFHQCFSFTPGIKEILILFTLLMLEGEKEKGNYKYDIIIFDLPPTGHGAFYLKIPQTMIDILRFGPIVKDAKIIQSLIFDETKTLLNIVTIPEEMPVNEAIDLITDVKKNLKIPIGYLFINTVTPNTFKKDEIDFIITSDGDLKNLMKNYFKEGEREALFESANAFIQRKELQNYYIEKLNKNFNKCIELPYIYSEKFGLNEIKKLSKLIDKQIKLKENV